MVRRAVDWKTQENRLGITLAQQSLIKRYVSGYDAITHTFLQLKRKMDFYEVLSSEKLSNKYKEYRLSILSNVAVPFKGVTEVVPMPSYEKTWAKVIDRLDNLKGKGVILNLYSKLGEEGLKAGSLVTESLVTAGLKLVTTNGVELNAKFTSFEDGESKEVSKMLNKDALVIFSVNSIGATQFKKDALAELYTLGSISGKPIIVTSKAKMVNEQYKVVNIGFTDEVLTETQLLKQVFDL